MPAISDLTPPPRGLLPTDLVVITRTAPPNSPVEQCADVSYVMTLAQAAAFFASVASVPVFVFATGTTADSAAVLTQGVDNIINAGVAGAGVVLPGTPGRAPIFNNTAFVPVLYPPLIVNAVRTGFVASSINGLAPGTSVPLEAGVSLVARSEDGINWYVG